MNLQEGQVYKSKATTGYEWCDTFMNIDKIYKNGRIKVSIGTAAIGKDSRVFDKLVVLKKIQDLNFKLIFDGINLVD
jgi:hypothetical protein